MNLYFILVISSFLSINSQATCEINKNNCKICTPHNFLCKECLLDIYTPDENGGCIPSKKCILAQNYCNECNSKGNQCLVCDIGYYPDENGACSFTDNCEISYKGECLICKEDFILLDNKFCKYKYNDDLLNCKIINTSNGLCETCDKNYYLNSGDLKCIDIENCYESKLGICQMCNEGFYLDKQDNKCKEKTDIFVNCKITIDGKNCDECSNGYYFTEVDNKCVSTNFCYESENNYCKKCIDGYFLTENGLSCSKEEKCSYADKDTGICISCINGYYLDINNGTCKSNQENNKFKFCKIFYEKCISCQNDYALSEDGKCTSTDNCIETENGICLSCKDNFYLGLDNKCNFVEHCIYSGNSTSSYSNCKECELNYYYNYNTMKCLNATEKFINCKSSDYDGVNCSVCRDNFYLSQIDHLCYNNSEKNIFYKCERTDINGTFCDSCINGYFLGEKDKLCSKIEGCSISENENKCLECDEYYCLNKKNGKCYDNYYPPEEENNLIYFNCNKTNEDGTECEECVSDNFEIINGLCYNIGGCEKMEDGKCIECKDWKEDNMGWSIFCINKDFGCVEGYTLNCNKCDNSLDFKNCNECKEGFEFNEFNDCIEVE